MQYKVILSDGAEIEVEANSADGAIREATERGEQVASVELNLDNVGSRGVNSAVLQTMTNSEEIVIVAKAIAGRWLQVEENHVHVAIGMIAEVLAQRNAEVQS